MHVNETWIKMVGLIAFMLILLATGVVCLFFSAAVQRIAVRLVGYGLSSQIGPLKKFVSSPSYLISVKSVGVIAILGFIFLLWASTHSN